MRLHIMPAVLTSLAFVLGGCAVVPPQQQSVPLPASALRADAGRVGVAMSVVPRADTVFPGAGHGLCLASAAYRHSLLTNHVHVLSPRDMPVLKERAASLVAARGATPVLLADALDLETLPDFGGVMAGTPGVARKDFRSFKELQRLDKLLVIQIDSLGVARGYGADCVADAEPRAVFDGAAYLVDLKTNALQWYHPVHVAREIDGNWDAWPKYPHLDTAFFQALQQGKDELLRPLQ
ncbi:hypothetical protein ACG04R_01465 [Roseateles sp. BYS78W]|uniref:Lipoprotein n=1 Tax=Pelomonas candidula TaxID=3299025 RepID=A0ABW7H6Z0_9BURK